MSKTKVGPNDQEHQLFRTGRPPLVVRLDNNDGRTLDAGEIETQADTDRVVGHIRGISAQRVVLRFNPLERIDPKELIRKAHECQSHIKGLCELVCQFPPLRTSELTFYAAHAASLAIEELKIRGQVVHGSTEPQAPASKPTVPTNEEIVGAMALLRPGMLFSLSRKPHADGNGVADTVDWYEREPEKLSPEEDRKAAQREALAQLVEAVEFADESGLLATMLERSHGDLQEFAMSARTTMGDALEELKKFEI